LTEHRAAAVVLATGGAGRLYRGTTNGPMCTGDGVLLGWRAGAQVADLEMVQYHPTTLPDGTLISEAARGAGAVLRNADGKRFMESYAPEFMELAPRDIVARAIWTEIHAGRGIAGGVGLDFRSIDRRYWDMPHIQKMRDDCIERQGIDIRETPAAVRPGMHYMMGGLRTDVDGKTCVPGLFAAGETACVSVHGANRLGGNSLLDARVFGRRAGRAAARASSVRQSASSPVGPVGLPPAFPEGTLDRVQSVMDALVGLERDGDRLREAELQLAALRRECTPASGERAPGEISHDLEADALLTLGELVASAAAFRRESRGAHRRIDCPRRDDVNWLVHSIRTHDQDGWTSSPVAITKWHPSEREY
jgi:succinate dehydrogenase / fumarate reductase flavoprotein subunit